MAIDLRKLIGSDIDRMPNGLPAEPHSVRNRATVTLPGKRNRKRRSNM